MIGWLMNKILDGAQTHISRGRNRPVDKTFRAPDPDQGSLPPSLDHRMSADHLARFIAEVVDEHIDLVPVRAGYTDVRGVPPCDPRLMMRILLYGYMIGVRSSRVIEQKCIDDAPFRWLAAGARPDYLAIARFRERHSSALGRLFVQALALCQAAGMVRLGRVALDGTRMRTDVLAARVATLLAKAERIDRAEEAALRKNGRGDHDTAAGERVATRRPPTPKRMAQRGLVGAVLLALTFAGGYAVAMHKTVTLSVDGLPMTVSTMKSRVIDVVRENGFAVGDHDELYPAAVQPVHQSDNIVLRRGRPLRLSIDGLPSKQVWTTALTVDEALKRLSMSEAAPLTASRASRLPLAGMALQVVSPKNVHVNDGGVARDLRLAAPNVGLLLAAAGAPLEQGDKVVPPASTPVTDGVQIAVTRIRMQNVTTRMPLPPSMRRIEDPSMNMSRRLVEDPGAAGTQNVTFAVSIVNGVETGRRLVAHEVVTPARPLVQRIGAKPGTEVGESEPPPGRACRRRGRRQLGHQHRQRLLRRRAVQPGHLGAQWWTALCAARRPGHPRRADRNRRGHSGTAGLGRLARMRRPPPGGELTVRLLGGTPSRRSTGGLFKWALSRRSGWRC
jgi:resuscitation-promoting factor RpfB